VALLVGLILFAVLDPPLGTILLVVCVGFEVVEATFWTRYLKRIRVRTGAEGMVGERAEVIEPCDPSGRVRLRGEIWAAECERGAAIGETVQVAAVERLTLVVEPAPAANPAFQRS
jgi:membrane protein implicated in regulation of membrane protease activity